MTRRDVLIGMYTFQDPYNGLTAIEVNSAYCVLQCPVQTCGAALNSLAN
jgi:hypothetical protein